MEGRQLPRPDRDKLHYPTSLTDKERTLFAPLPPTDELGGGKRAIDLHEVLNGVASS